MYICVYIFNSLNELQEFIKDTDAGLQRKLNESDHDGLVDIMEHLLAVRSRQRATDELFEPLKETITLLESYGQKIPEQAYVQLEVSVEGKSYNDHKLSISFTRCFTHTLMISSS
jgi:hypothetical protein